MTGRPPVGPAINLRFPDDLLAAIDKSAAAEGVTRAQWIRMACAARLAASGFR